MLLTKDSDFFIRSRVNEFIAGVVSAKSVKYFEANPNMYPRSSARRGIDSCVIIDKVNELIKHMNVQIDNKYLYFYCENSKHFIAYYADGETEEVFALSATIDMLI